MNSRGSLLRIQISVQGAAVAITVHDARSPQTGEQVAAIARKLSPFDAPDDSILECAVDHPFFLWMVVPGVSRPPVRIR